MSNLSEFLGSVLSEIAAARVEGDLESLRIADLYASHDLLKHFPVPRFRLPEVRMDFPAIVEDAAKAPGSTNIDPDRAYAIFREVVRFNLASSTLSLSDQAMARLERDAKETFVRAFTQELQHSMHKVATEATNLLDASLEADSQPAGDDRRKLLRGVRADLISRLAVERARKSTLKIVPNTAAVREVRDTDHLVRIQLSVTEEAVEWTVIETAAGEEPRLVPE